jgi:hypothetical protein
MFRDGDVENGEPLQGSDSGNIKVKGLVVIGGLEMEVGQMVDMCCGVLSQAAS